MTLALSLLIGVVAGLRTFTAPAAVSWAARLGRLDLGASMLAFAGYAYTPWILTAIAAVELVIDQLPTTPSRTVPVAFGARIVMGGLSGAALNATAGIAAGAAAGIAGAVIGTLGGRAARGWLAATLGNDHPAAIIEDIV